MSRAACQGHGPHGTSAWNRVVGAQRGGPLSLHSPISARIGSGSSQGGRQTEFSLRWGLGHGRSYCTRAEGVAMALSRGSTTGQLQEMGNLPPP